MCRGIKGMVGNKENMEIRKGDKDTLEGKRGRVFLEVNRSWNEIVNLGTYRVSTCFGVFDQKRQKGISKA